MKVMTLPNGALFELLFELCTRMNKARYPLRVIGGLAMYFWHSEKDGRARVTEDIDCAFPASDWSSIAVARPQILEVDAILREMGLQPDRTENWRASSTSRFTYMIPGEPSRIELLCGELSFGEKSRRVPAWKLLETDANESIYASKLPFIDFVTDWTPIDITRGGSKAKLEIPNIAGMMVLKLKAVVDKLVRYEEEQDEEKLEHELRRLRRHAEDLVSLMNWARSTPGELVSFSAISRSTEAVDSQTRELRSRIQNDNPPAPLADLYTRLREIAIYL